MAMFKSKILEEIENIPEAQLPQLYEIIHDFRLNIDSDTTSPRIPGRLKGTRAKTPNPKTFLMIKSREKITKSLRSS